jgi:hypothetical protein
MPERVVNFLTGVLPEPTFPIPLETWDDFDMEGLERIHCEIARVINMWGDVVRDIHREVDCPTEFYESYIGWTGTGIKIPESIIEEFGIKIEHYLEVILLSVKKGDVETPIYPGEMKEREIRKKVREVNPAPE